MRIEKYLIIALIVLVSACTGTSVNKRDEQSGTASSRPEVKKIKSYSEFEIYLNRRIANKDATVIDDLIDPLSLGFNIWLDMKRIDLVSQADKIKASYDLFGGFVPSTVDYDWQYIDTRKDDKFYNINYRVLDEEENLYFITLSVCKARDSYAICDIINHNIGMPLSHYGAEILRLFDKKNTPADQMIDLYELKKALDDGPDNVTDFINLNWNGAPNDFLYYVKTLSFKDDTSEAYRDHLKLCLDDYEQKGWLSFDAYTYYTLIGEDDLRKKALEKLLELTGDKAALYTLEAELLSAPKEFKVRIELLYQAILADPQYLDTYYGLMDAFVSIDNFDDAVLVLDVLNKRFQLEITPEEIITQDYYRQFTSSDAFKNWAEKQGAL